MDPDFIYLDHAATTPVDPEVVAAMLPYFTDNFGNPSSTHGAGYRAREAMEGARSRIACLIGASPHEIYFTSGGTEANNWVIKGAAAANRHRGDHIVTTAVEHHSVLDACRFLEKDGFRVTYLPVDRYGVVDADAVRRALTDRTILVSIMHANNEVGTIEPIAEIGKIVRTGNIVFHTDAVQTLGHLPLDVDGLHVDMLTASAHKLYGPKGIGLLYCRAGTRIDACLHGGQQERQYRAGTENVPGIIGFAAALEGAVERQQRQAAGLTVLRDRLLSGLRERITGVHLNGHPIARLPNNLSLRFDGTLAEAVLLELRLDGICASQGSACMSYSDEPSHVLLALGLSAEEARTSVRFSLGKGTTEQEVDRVVEVMPAFVERTRRRAWA